MSLWVSVRTVNFIHRVATHRVVFHCFGFIKSAARINIQLSEDVPNPSSPPTITPTPAAPSSYLHDVSQFPLMYLIRFVMFRIKYTFLSSSSERGEEAEGGLMVGWLWEGVGGGVIEGVRRCKGIREDREGHFENTIGCLLVRAIAWWSKRSFDYTKDKIVIITARLYYRRVNYIRVHFTVIPLDFIADLWMYYRSLGCITDLSVVLQIARLFYRPLGGYYTERSMVL